MLFRSKALLQNQVDSIIKQQEKTITEMGGMIGNMMSSEQKNMISNSIKNIIETNVTTSTLNDMLNSFSFDQEVGIIADGGSVFVEGDCNVTNSIQGIEFQSQSIIGNVVRTVISNESFNKAVNDLQQSQESEIKGLSDIVDSVGEALTSVISASTGPMIAFFVVGGIVAIVGIVVFFASGGKASDLKALMKDPSASPAQKAAAKSKYTKLGLLDKYKNVIIGFIVLLFMIFLGLGLWQLLEYNQAKNNPEEVNKYPDCQDEYDAIIPIYKRVEELDEQISNAVSDSERNDLKATRNDILIENEDKLKAYNDCLNDKYGAGVDIKIERGTGVPIKTVEGYASVNLFHNDYYTLRGYQSPKAQFRSWW